MVALLAALALLVDGGGAALAPPRTIQVENLGAAPVTLLLQRSDGGYSWGPYALGPHEVLRIAYCPCARLTLELRSGQRPKALRYPLTDQSALLLSEDRWSEGEPIVRHEAPATTCGAAVRCAGPDFRVSR